MRVKLLLSAPLACSKMCQRDKMMRGRNEKQVGNRFVSNLKKKTLTWKIHEKFPANNNSFAVASLFFVKDTSLSRGNFFEHSL